MILLAFLIITIVVCAFAIIGGGGPERWTAAIFLGGVMLSISVSIYWPPPPDGFQLGIFCIDSLMLLAMGWILFRARRYWPIATTAMQLLAVMGHLIKFVDPNELTVLYWLTNAFWAVPQLVILLVATIRHRARLSRLGTDPSWTDLPPTTS